MRSKRMLVLCVACMVIWWASVGRGLANGVYVGHVGRLVLNLFIAVGWTVTTAAWFLRIRMEARNAAEPENSAAEPEKPEPSDRAPGPVDHASEPVNLKPEDHASDPDGENTV